MKTGVLILFFVLLLLFYRKKEFILGKYLPKILAIDKVLISYFIVAIIFAAAYYLIDTYLFFLGDKTQLTIPGAHPFDYIYFSLITQLTIGYGDISPKYGLVRFLVTLQGVSGTILIGGIIASIIQYSSLLRIKGIFIALGWHDEHGRLLDFNLKLDYNPTTVYNDINVKIYCFDKDDEVIIAKKNLEKLSKSKNLKLSCLNEDYAEGIISSKDNKISYESFNIYENEGEQIEKLLKFQIDELIVELSYSIGTNTFTNKVKTTNLASFSKMLEGKKRVASIDSKSLIEIQSY